MNETSLVRRKMLKRGTVMLISAATLPLAVANRSACAGSAAASEFHYQDHPKDGKKCSDCFAFEPNARAPNAAGTCRLLAGPVSPSGWCMAFSKK